MCYPSAPKGEDDYIPNWVLWYIVQLGDCLKRTGDRQFIEKHKAQVYKVLEFFKGYENEYGLLESLGGWVFVEWSKANDFIDGVNFPSNMLYAGAIKAAGELYGDADLIEKFHKLKDVIISLSFDGEHFVDNALRQNGKLILTHNVSETCQNYAAFFEILTSAESPEFYAKLKDRFGALDEGSAKRVWRSNMFIGYILRLEVLYREGMYNQIIVEGKEAFLPMARATGTIWEHFETHSSCNHGFGSIVGMLLYNSYKKTIKEENGNEQ
jgi:alpha-L-rhamnosidase